MVPGDLAYVFSTWLRDLRDADPSGLPDDLWFPAHRAFVERLLGEKSTLALVASAADAPTEILGYVVARVAPSGAESLEWIHVRKPLRGKGLAKRLLVAAAVSETTPARWSTPSSRQRLRNPNRSRQLRRDSGAQTPG